MSQRFISRIFAIELPDGRVQLSWEYSPDNYRSRPLTFLGPKPLSISVEPMTQEEFQAWQRRTIEHDGYTLRIETSRSMGAKSIEDTDDPARLVQFADVMTELGIYDGGMDPKTIMVTVRNTTRVPIPSLRIALCSENENPQPVEDLDIPAMEVAQELGFESERSFDGTLNAGATAKFILAHYFLEPFLGRIAALSPERYWISIQSSGHELSRIDGPTLADFLAEEEMV